MPSFNEDSVEECFRCFEKVALALKWPKESWVIMVQSALICRAQKCFNLLPEQEGYAEHKRLVLREYELRPESYRLKFRKNRKLSDSETYVDYSRAKKLDLDKWLDSSDINDEYLKLYDLILLEEFKRQLPSEVKVHLDDKEIKDPYEASKTADDYSICHRLTRRTGVSESHFKMSGNTQSQHHTNKDNDADDSGRTKEKGKSFEKRDLSTILCFKCREMGHHAKSCTSAENKASAFKNWDLKVCQMIRKKMIDVLV